MAAARPGGSAEARRLGGAEPGCPVRLDGLAACRSSVRATGRGRQAPSVQIGPAKRSDAVTVDDALTSIAATALAPCSESGHGPRAPTSVLALPDNVVGQIVDGELAAGEPRNQI